jgi:3,4-dihydroxy 2-butanone 4-phosphate synthase/GTP cyclohydrolase II
MEFSAIDEASSVMAEGGMVVVVDDVEGGNEGALVMAAESATPESIAFYIAHTSGVICVPLLPERTDQLDLPLMVPANRPGRGSPFTISVDARIGTTTGISAADRASTVATLIDPDACPTDLLRPGHIFPLRTLPGGVLKRPRYAEATVDLSRLAAMTPAGVLCEILTKDRSGAARLPDLAEFAHQYGLPLISLSDLVRYRRETEELVRTVANARVPTVAGDARAYVFESLLDGSEHLAVVIGEVSRQTDVPVYVQFECLMSDVFGSRSCDCGLELRAAMSYLQREGRGVIVYLRSQADLGRSLDHTIERSMRSDHAAAEMTTTVGMPVPKAYGVAAHILLDLGVKTVRLVTNKPPTNGGLERFGLKVTERVSIELSEVLSA